MNAGNPPPGENPDPRQKSLINAVRGPIIMITVGVLFLLDQFTSLAFHRTWPVILIVAGLLSLARWQGGGRPW
jgi:hypothetical protein